MQPHTLESLRSTEHMFDYNENSSAQQLLVHLKTDIIRDLVTRIGLVRPEMKVVDFGCGQGVSTVEVARAAVDAYRGRHPDAPIAICHADQPGNDWNALFEHATGPAGYLGGRKGVRAKAAAGSFYDVMTTERSVDLATCFVASHWLSHAHRLLSPNTLWFADLTGEARAEMARFARQDWIRFLRCRAAELRQGGYLLVSTLGAVPDETETNGIAVSGRGLYRAMYRIAQEMADEGLLDREVLDGFVFSLWFLSTDEAREPLENDPALAELFEIEDIRTEPTPVNPDDLFIDEISNPREYARLYTGYTRAFADSTLHTQLFEPSADSPKEADRLADEFFDRFEHLYQAFPGKFSCELWHLTVLLRRR